MSQRNRFLGNLTTAEAEAARKAAGANAAKADREAENAPLSLSAPEPREGEVQAKAKAKAKKKDPEPKPEPEAKEPAGTDNDPAKTDQDPDSKDKPKPKTKSKKARKKNKAKAKDQVKDQAGTEDTAETKQETEAKEGAGSKGKGKSKKGKKKKAKAKDKAKEKDASSVKEEPAIPVEEEKPAAPVEEATPTVPAEEVPPAEEAVTPEEETVPEEEAVLIVGRPPRHDHARQRPTSSRHVKRHRTRSPRLRAQAETEIPEESEALPAATAAQEPLTPEAAEVPAASEAAEQPKPEKHPGWLRRNIPAAVIMCVIVAGLLFGAVPLWMEEAPAFALKANEAKEELITGIEWTERVLDRLPQAKSGAVAMGNYTPSKAVRDALKEEIAEVRESGHHVGFVMLDLESGQGLAYDTGREFYGASSIKIHRIMAIVSKHPSVLTEYRGSIRAVLTYSDNDAYATLYRAYGNGVLNAWIKKAGAKVRYNPSMQYVYYDTASLSRLWFLDYKAMESGKDYEQVGKWAENPELSPIHQVLGKNHTTRSKAGWIAEGGYYAAVDGGIVYGKDSDYLIVVMSDYGADLNRLKPIIRTLDRAHTEARKQLEAKEEEPKKEPEKKLKFPF